MVAARAARNERFFRSVEAHATNSDAQSDSNGQVEPSFSVSCCCCCYLLQTSKRRQGEEWAAATSVYVCVHVTSHVVRASCSRPSDLAGSFSNHRSSCITLHKVGQLEKIALHER